MGLNLGNRLRADVAGGAERDRSLREGPLSGVPGISGWKAKGRERN